MSTKINARSPFYLNYSEPTEPSVELTCALIGLNNLSVDQFGNVILPNTNYGSILSYTSTASDFADGLFATVAVATSRTITFTISIPPNFTNALDDTIDCTASATQPIFNCTGGVTTNGTIPSQSLNTNGDTVSIDLSSYFTQGVAAISSYIITNNYPEIFTYSLVGSILKIISNNKAGTQNLYVEAKDGDAATCNATQPIAITTTAQNAYTCTDSYLSGGDISQSGTITDPSANGLIPSKSATSGGATITSYPANTTASARDVILYFNITVPDGYSNTAATVICPKTFSQPTTALPLFTCDVAAISGSAITPTGIISVGVSEKGSITDFTPIKFDSVTSSTPRTVDFEVTIPSTGYSNSTDDPITCPVDMNQPPSPNLLTCGDTDWYLGGSFPFMTIAQAQAAFPLSSPVYYGSSAFSPEAALNLNGVNNSASIGSNANQAVSLQSDTMTLNLNTVACAGHDDNTTQIVKFPASAINPTGGMYHRVTKIQELYYVPTPTSLGDSYYIKIEISGVISEVWFVKWDLGKFTKIT
tara:strand:+ start:522 stop:2120 length:1599 start_codon:yes stop_codon:yes gene_type:complete